MRLPIISAALALALALTASAHAATVAQWTFDTNQQNWNVTFPSGTGNASMFQSSGGNTGNSPDGYLRATDRSGFQTIGPWYFELNQTPVNYSAAFNGSLSFDLKSFAPIGTPFSSTDVSLSGAGFILQTDASVQPTADWSTFAVNLTSANWHFLGGTQHPTDAQFQSILGALQDLQIRGDYSTGPGTTPGSSGFDDTGLDNVIFASPAAVAVPLPPAAVSGLLLLGLLAVGRKKLVKL